MNNPATLTTADPFDGLVLEVQTTGDLIEMLDVLTAKGQRTSNPVVKQALALRAYEVESVIAVRNARVMADLDAEVERRTVERIAEWLRGMDDHHLHDTLASAVERGEWRSR